MRFDQEILQTYPYPLAIAAKRVNDATECVEEYMRLANLFEVTLRYLAFVGLAQYLRDDTVDERTQKQLKKLRRPTLGVWNEILRASVRFYAENQDRPFAVPELRDGYATKLRQRDPGTAEMLAWFHAVAEYLGDEAKARRKRISVQNLLDLMVQYRNETWGHGIQQLTPDFCEEQIERFLPGMQGLLEWLAFLTSYPLRYVKEVRIVKGQKTHVMFDYTGMISQQGDPYVGEYVREERLHLCDNQGAPVLSVHPLLVVSHCRLYVLEYYEPEESTRYSDCETGKPLERREISSDALGRLIDDRHDKLSDTDLELPIPPKEDGLEIDETPFLPSLEELIGQLSAEGRQALEIALGEALRIGRFWLGVEFLLMGLSKQEGQPLGNLLHELRASRGEFRGLLRRMVGVAVEGDGWKRADVAALGSEALDHLQPANPDTLAADFAAHEEHPPVVTPRMMQVLRDAAQMAGEKQIGHAHLLLAALRHTPCPPINALYGLAVQAGWKPRDVPAWVTQQANLKPPGPAQPGEPPPGEVPAGPAGPGSGEPPPLKVRGVLATRGRDLTALARAGQLRPAIGDRAHKAMVQMGLILQQTQANNPILLGDPGVGKTAIVEGFAWRLAVGAKHDQPVAPQLAGRRVVDLSPTALLAGTKHRGDLEERLQRLVQEVREGADSTIVFIDEIHTILGGRAEGGLGAISDALKPALARGEFPCIGATTVGEYRRYIEADPALARRFTPVWIEEPSVEEAIPIVREVAQGHLGPSHKVEYPDAVAEEAVRLSARYLHDERLPGKAIKLLDQAGPRVVMGESLRGHELDKDQSVGGVVTLEIVREIVAERTSIPLTQLTRSDKERLLTLENRLKERVKGQDEAVAQVARAVKRAHAGLADPRRPLGVFLFAGPTGVGKTELALALAEALFDEEDAILRLDMSEYMEKHQISRLIGSPPGYVGYEEVGQLTGRLRRRPYSVVLLDEVEKAHEDVQHLFLQLFDAGRLTDARGNLADGRNAIFVMTTNLGAKQALGFVHERKTYQEMLHAAIEEHFTLEFLNRVDRTVCFEPLSEETLLAIVDKLLARMVSRFEAQGIHVEVTSELKRDVCRRHSDARRGARDLQRAIEDEIVAPLSDRLLAGEIEPGMRVKVGESAQVDAKKRARGRRQAKGGVERPPEPQGPARPQPPAPGTDERDAERARNKQAFEGEFGALAARLGERGIEVEVTAEAQAFLCDPFWTESPLQQALVRLVEEPLLQQLAEGELKPGDRVQVEKYADHLEFKKAEGGEE